MATSFPSGGPGVWAEFVGWGVTGGLLGAWTSTMLVRVVAGGRASGVRLRIFGFCWLTAAAVLVGHVLFGTEVGLAIRWVPTSLLGVAGVLVVALSVAAMVQWLRSAVEWWLDLRPSENRRLCLVIPLLGGAVIGGLMLGSWP